MNVNRKGKHTAYEEAKQRQTAERDEQVRKRRKKNMAKKEREKCTTC